MISRLSRLICPMLFLFVLAGCASAPDSTSAESNQTQSGDPFEVFNRSMWTINYDYIDPYLVRPVAIAYVDYIPHPISKTIANVLSNLDEPSSIINNILMGNGTKAVDHFNRFWINSTLGLFGMIDIASEAGITKHNEKAFSDAVGHYGVGNGPYLMIPGYGPYTIRETTDVVDGLYVPLSYLNVWAGLGKWALEGLETRARLVPQEVTLENSPDPYSLTRDVYLQRQDFKAEIDTQTYDESEEEYLDDYLEEGF
ncbi:MlaA family lipoprotein [Vibrio sp. ZOR0018]|uniref:MlaA family lipoprotein n=1 Tax=Vibrio sp. ZOR0018 TaxID=1339225 RepID=UPI000645A35E|nr:MlaA family lipoprotein [Vibrio sp. ZOR0018]